MKKGVLIFTTFIICIAATAQTGGEFELCDWLKTGKKAADINFHEHVGESIGHLSHYAVLDKCEKLVTAGIIDTKKDERNRLFAITEKGIAFFKEFQRFQDLVQSMNLRY